MLKIHLKTGTAWTKSITVEGTGKSDLIECIDEYYQEHDELPVPIYTMDELEESELEEMIPINGGKYWIDGIEYIEEYPIVKINEYLPTVSIDTYIDEYFFEGYQAEELLAEAEKNKKDGEWLEDYFRRICVEW